MNNIYNTVYYNDYPSTDIRLPNGGIRREYHDIFNTIKYFLNGIEHRTDGPSYIDNSGVKCWVQFGKLHRLNGPAYIDKYCKEYWVNDQRHRINGPAYIERKQDGVREWYIEGIKVTDEFPQWMKDNHVKYPFNKSDRMLFNLRWVQYNCQ
jgi:hypothetical protein